MDGKIVEVKGPVVDVKFEDGNHPKINDALKVNVSDNDNNCVEIRLFVVSQWIQQMDL